MENRPAVGVAAEQHPARLHLGLSIWKNATAKRFKGVG
jgi:hypothetical protein